MSFLYFLPLIIFHFLIRQEIQCGFVRMIRENIEPMDEEENSCEIYEEMWMS